MSDRAATTKQFEVGNYTCPKTGKYLPLLSLQLEPMKWPVIIKECASCGGTHLLQRHDVVRPPVFGYE